MSTKGTNNKPQISFQDTEALPYIEEVATKLRENTIAMLRELPDEMKIGGKAVNGSIKGVFRECNFIFAMFVERDPMRYKRTTAGTVSNVWIHAGIGCLKRSKQEKPFFLMIPK